MVTDTSVFTSSSCYEASLTWVLGGARDAYSVHPSGNISAQITVNPASVSTTALLGMGVCYGSNRFDAQISKVSFRSSNSILLNRGRYRPRRQGHQAGTGLVLVVSEEANVT